jgi:N-acetylmuramoyl-L-alanine amidase
MILKLGIKGERVKELQLLLKEHGFWPAGQGITDYFGPVTKKAVVDFQRKNKLKVDGIVGPATWAILTKSVKNKIKPVYLVEDKNEDFSDPEDEMLIDDVVEGQPTCPNLSELIKLINSAKITRHITRLVFHCTATHHSATVEGILRYWKSKGWTNPGYHIIVRPDGSWTQLQDFNRRTNGVAGINSTSLHISYIGGIDKNGKAFDNRTEEQKDVFETVYWTFKNKMPNLTFHGHYEFSNKACPSYKVEPWLAELEKNKGF